MPVENTYALVLKALDIAQKRPWTPESVRAVEWATEAWWWKYIQPYPHMLGSESFVAAQSVTRRSWKKPVEKWAHLPSVERGMFAQAHFYNLLTNLLKRVKYNPASLTPHFWEEFMCELFDCHTVMRQAYRPSPEPVLDALAHYDQKQLLPLLKEERDNMPEWLVNFLEETRGPSPESETH